MRKLIMMLLAGLILSQAGCAAGLHVGGQRHGVGADAAIGRDPLVVAPSP